jgi:two-component system, OmpR family, sensor histidine kinase CiaH
MRFTLSYTFLFLYVITAIVWWGYSHFLKSDEIYALEKSKIELEQKLNPTKDYSQDFIIAQKKLDTEYAQYWGEGLTFLIIILVSAFFVYRAFYKQLKLTKLQRNFMMSITHELKTPLAGVILNIQTLLRRKVPEEMQRKLLATTESEAKRLSDLCNNILIATQLEDGAKKVEMGGCNITEVVENVVDNFAKRNRNRRINTDIGEERIEVKGDENLWGLVLSNLLENAKKYSPDGTEICISLKSKEGTWVLAVSDVGNGISDEDKKKIFNKFYRVGSEETRKTKGTGLGLFLVKKLVMLFKYDINVKNNQPVGSIFEIVFK